MREIRETSLEDRSDVVAYGKRLFDSYVSYSGVLFGYLKNDGTYASFRFGDDVQGRLDDVLGDVRNWSGDCFEEYLDSDYVTRIYREFLLGDVIYFFSVVIDESLREDVSNDVMIEQLRSYIFKELNSMYHIEIEERLFNYEYRDSLTGLYNRKKFLNDVNELIDREELFSLFRIKVMSLHKINTVFGNRVGDEMLRIFTSRLKGLSGLSMYRINGSEFMVVCDISNEDRVRNDVLSALTLPVRCMMNRLKVEAFIGLVRHQDILETYTELEFNSSVSLEHGKLLGVNRVGEFKNEIKMKKSLDSRIAEALPKAIERRQFDVYYQAQLSVDKRRPVGLEALLRWKLDGEFISPMQFIPIAEENGYILDIGYLVFEEVCKYQRKLTRLGIDLSVAVNVSVRQVLDEEFVTRVSDIVDRTGVDVSMIDIEITESMDVGADEFVDVRIKKLKDMGFKIVMDDFGTGYSSLGYLRNGMFDKLKIDREFIKNISTEDERDVDRMLILSMIDMADGVGMVVVVEGVETLDQVEFLKSTKCDIVQGFVYSRPVSEGEMLDYLLSYED